MEKPFFLGKFAAYTTYILLLALGVAILVLVVLPALQLTSEEWSEQRDGMFTIFTAYIALASTWVVRELALTKFFKQHKSLNDSLRSTQEILKKVKQDEVDRILTNFAIEFERACRVERDVLYRRAQGDKEVSENMVFGVQEFTATARASFWNTYHAAGLANHMVKNDFKDYLPPEDGQEGEVETSDSPPEDSAESDEAEEQDIDIPPAPTMVGPERPDEMSHNTT